MHVHEQKSTWIADKALIENQKMAMFASNIQRKKIFINEMCNWSTCTQHAPLKDELIMITSLLVSIIYSSNGEFKIQNKTWFNTQILIGLMNKRFVSHLDSETWTSNACKNKDADLLNIIGHSFWPQADERFDCI